MKKILTLIAALSLVASLAVGGSIAYLTDRDSEANVFTVGNVEIDLSEEYQQGAELTPGFTVEKKPVITNTGKNDAWVWMTVAIPSELVDVKHPLDEDGMDVLFATYNLSNTPWNIMQTEEPVNVEINNKNYVLTTLLYNDKLVPGAVTEAAMGGIHVIDALDIAPDGTVSVVMNGSVTKTEWNVKTNDEPVVYVSAYAIQTEGFETVELAYAAYNAQWGSNGTEYETPGTLVKNSSALTSAMTTLPNGEDITKKVVKIVYGKTSDYPEIVNGDYEFSEAEGVTSYYVPNGSSYDVYMLSEGVIYAPKNSQSLFQDMSSVKEIDTSNLDMSRVENAKLMFCNCSKLETLDTSDWDMSNVTNMQSIFYGCNNLKDIDVSNWDTSNVTNMRMVFFRCYALSNDVLKGVENWDVSNVTNFYSMFKHARGLTSLDLSNWDTSNATNMSHLFANIGGLEKLDLSGFDTSKVTDMSWMFYDGSKLTEILVGEGWTTAALDPSNPTCFYNNQALVGGNGTTWLDVCDMANANRPWESSAKLQYAIADGGTSNPGLLTLKK